MSDSATGKELMWPRVSFALRYSLAFASVAGALLLDLLFHHFNLPRPFAAFALSAIAITFWYGGTKPGIVAVLLSSLIRSFISEGETSGVSRVLYDLVFLIFAILMIWVRREREALEVRIADRTAKFTAANDDLLRQKEQLDALFELSPDAIILTDDNFHVLRVNKEFSRIFGYTAEEVAGQWLPELIVPEELRAEAQRYRDRLMSGNRVELETVRQHKDGSRFDFSVVSKGISLGFDKVAFYLIYRDITERKKAERELTRSKATLLESQRLVHMCSWAYNPSTGMATFSPEMKRIYNLESDQDAWPTEFFRDMVHPEDRPIVLEIVRRAHLDKTDYDISYRIVPPDGSIKHVHTVGHSIVNESGELVEVVGSSMDVTEQWTARTELEKAFTEIKQQTEATRRSERELRDVVNMVPAHVWSTSPEGQVDFVNDRWLQFTGLALDEAFGWKWEAVLHPEDRMRVDVDWRKAIQFGQPVESEARVRRADGEYRWWSFRNEPLRDETGKIIKWYGTAIDIEDRKQAEQALRKSEERWRSVFENSAIGVAVTDLNGRFLATNHVFQAMVGYTEEELHAVRFLDITHEDYREANWALVTELLEGKRRQFQIEKKYLRKDGRSMWVSNNVSLVPGTERVPQFIMALSEDITERKRAEEALKRSEANLAEAQRMTHTGSWAYNPAKNKTVYWSAEMFRICGFDPRQGPPTSEAFLERVPSEDRKRVHDAFYNALQGKREYEAEHRIILFDGTIKHIYSIGHPVLNRSGDVVEFVGSAADVTDRKRAEEALQRSEAYLAEGQKLAKTGSWAYNPAEEKHIYWSAEMLRIFGLDPQSKPPDRAEFLRLVHPEDRDRLNEQIEKSRREKIDFVQDYRIVLTDGTVKHIHGTGHSVLDETGNIVEYVGTDVDVTERKRAEEERERLRQLEADLAHMNRVTMLGELASSLAHELNQPISAAITSANACLRWLAHNPPDLERACAAATRIKNDGSRAAEIIQRLRAFYKTGAPPQRESVDLNEVAGEMLLLLRNEATRQSISLRTELAPQLPRITADRVQLQQVLMNLMLNGIEAMTDGVGELTIKSQTTEDGLPLISVSDTGVGLPNEKLDQIFNAFYTTKPHGTGMGLAISRSIVEAHGGRLWATANAERGATFHFTLPVEMQQ